MSEKYKEIDALLNDIVKEVSLRDLFENRLYTLKITQTAAEKIIGVGHRPLNGLLDGTQKRVDYLTLNKVAIFLNMPIEQLVEAHLLLLEKNFAEQNTPINKKKFIKENFDLTVLKKAGFIDNVSDFERIEKKIISFFGLNSLFDYKKRSFDTAFSSGIVSSKNHIKNSITRDFWLTTCKRLVQTYNNQYDYNRQELINFFPQIRWHSTNVELGLVQVIKSLFKIGITVIFQPPLSTLHLRGATFSVNDKPAIALTDYKGFYPTLWHCLIHELYHVLFDWEEIKTNSYHITEDTDQTLVLDEKEVEADSFARQYLFSEEKSKEAFSFIRDENYIKEIAKNNNVHPSIIHIYNAFDNGKTDRMVWARARRHMPDVKNAVYRLEIAWDESKSIDEIIKKKKLEIYN